MAEITNRSYRSPLMELLLGKAASVGADSFNVGLQGAQRANLAEQQQALDIEENKAKLDQAQTSLGELLRGKAPANGGMGPREQPMLKPGDTAQVGPISIHPNDPNAGRLARDDRDRFHSDQMFQQTQRLLESSTGDPEVQQAKRDRLSIKKANALFDKNPDLDKINPELATLIDTEISKIAKGGVSTVAELEALDPKTIKGQFAKTLQKFSNEPTPANRGAFLKQYKDYLDDLKKVTDQTIDSRFTRVLESRKESGLLRPEHYNALAKQYYPQFGIGEAAPEGRRPTPAEWKALKKAKAGK
jgi:hypothetical protein